MAPLQHQPGSDDAVFRPVGVNTMKPIDEAHREALRPARIDPTDANPKVKKIKAKLAKLEAVDAPASVLTRQRAKLAEARDAVLEKIALKRGAEREKTLADQREQVRLRHEREVLTRMDGSLMPSLSITFGPLTVTTEPERSVSEKERDMAYKDFEVATKLIRGVASSAVIMARNAKTKIEVLPVQIDGVLRDVSFLKRRLENEMRFSIAAGLTSIEEIR